MKEFFLRLRAYTIIKRHGIQDQYIKFLDDLITSELDQYNLINSITTAKNKTIMDDKVVREITADLVKTVISKVSNIRRVLIEEYFIGRGNLLSYVTTKVYNNTLKLAIVNNAKIL